MTENITPPVLPNAVANVPAVGDMGAGSVTDEVVTVKDLMKQVTGKTFPDDETAIKSLSDTYKWGAENAQKVKTLTDQLQAAQGQVSPDLAKRVDELTATVKSQNFYQAHPELNKPQLQSLISKMGGPSEELLQDDTFKTTVAAINKSLEMDESQSILHSNPRLGIVQDSMTKASEAQKAGNDVSAAALATAAVLEAYPDIASKGR